MYNPETLAEEIADMLDNKKAGNILVLDIRKLTTIADFFVIASGRSELQTKAFYSELTEKLGEKGIFPLHTDGNDSGRWIVLDYGYVIVHMFHHEERAFFSLERLWADAGVIYSRN